MDYRMDYIAPTRENIPSRFEALKREHIYCSGCGAKMQLDVNVEYEFDRRSGLKTPRYSTHTWACPESKTWWQQQIHDPELWDRQNPHD